MTVPPLRVVVVRRSGLSMPEDEREVGWPGHWRLPMVGESIRLTDGFGGFIQWIEWQIDQGLVRISVR